MPVKQEYASLFPNQHVVANGLIVLLFLCGGRYKACASRDCYQPLARYFNISEFAQKISRCEYYTDDTSNSLAWENIVQWGRRELKDDGHLQASPRGVWRLSERGCRKAEMLIKKLTPAAIGQLENYRDIFWKGPS